MRARAAEELRAPDGTRLGLHRFDGPARAPRVLIVPGFWRSGLSPGMRGLAAHLSRRYRPRILDPRGHGRSGGVYTFGREEWRDLTLVLEWLQAEEGSPLAVVGFSMGGAIALVAVGRGKERLPCVVSLASVAAPVDPAVLVPRWWRMSALLQLRPSEVWRVPRFLPPQLVRDRPDTLAAAGEVSPVPLLVLHGRGDWIVPERDAAAIFRAARDPKELRFLEGRWGFHADALFRLRRAQFVSVLDPWLEGTFRSASGAEVPS